MISKRKAKLPRDPVETRIESLSHEGRGVARVQGKTVFIDRALPGERVRFRYERIRASYDEGSAVEVLEPAPGRVQPGCPHFGVCGGCSLQHMSSARQLEHKQSILLEQLSHIGRVEPDLVREPLTGPAWGYRRKTRLGARFVIKKQKLVLGFREKRGAYLADIDACEVLHPELGHRLGELRGLLEGLSIRDHIPQLEAAAGENASAVVLRHLQPVPDGDRSRLERFQRESGIDIYLQSGGPDTITPLDPEQASPLEYRLEAHDITIRFGPADFTQVNFDINDRLIDQVLDLLQPGPDDLILDLFCGLGNFTLPLARRAGRVSGVEGDRHLVQRARDNAAANGIANAEFHAIDLAREDLHANFLAVPFNKLLLDPPRSGARGIIEYLDLENVDRIVYVSCNPATLARDAGILVRDKGFTLREAGVLDMFPHTTHVESIVLFRR